MTEEGIRRIVREEIEKTKPLTHYKGIPLPPNSPIVGAYPPRDLPMPVYRYQTPEGVSLGHSAPLKWEANAVETSDPRE